MESKNDNSFKFGGEDNNVFGNDTIPNNESNIMFGKPIPNKKKKEYLLSNYKTKTILYTRDAKFYVVRNVLSKASPFFKSMFENKKNTEVKVPIKEYTSNIVYEAMKFIHAPSYMKYEVPFEYCFELIAFSHQYDIKSLYEDQSLVYEKYYLEECKLHHMITKHGSIQQYKLINCDKKFTETIINKLGKKQDDLTDADYAIILCLDQSKKDELLLKSMTKLKEIRKCINKINNDRLRNVIFFDVDKSLKHLQSL